MAKDRHISGFDPLRLGAAVLVIFSHSFALVGRDEPLVFRFRSSGVTFGSFAVACFFVTSGFLVTRSWLDSPGGARFVRNRVLRIWPALIVVVVLTVFVVGPLATSSSITSYASAHATARYLGNATLLPPTVYTLPGVFARAPLTAVNGSLWTLRYEILAYVGLFALCVVGAVRSIRLMALVFAALVAGQQLFSVAMKMDATVVGFMPSRAFTLGAWFVGGALLALIHRRVGITTRGAAIAAVAVGAAVITKWSLPYVVAAPYLVVWLGLHSPSWARSLRRLGDPTYGTYLYAFPVQQLLVSSRLHVTNPWLLFLEATALTVPLGYASWHLIERRALRWKRTTTDRSVPIIESLEGLAIT
jgi:peptidoglycan/LPS O-acetylase OafA/YrhL